MFKWEFHLFRFGLLNQVWKYKTGYNMVAASLLETIFLKTNICALIQYIYTVYLFIYCTVQYSTVYITYCICISWLMSFTIYSFRWYFYSNCIPCSVATSTKHLFAWNSRNMRRQRSSTERTSRERTVVQHILWCSAYIYIYSTVYSTYTVYSTVYNTVQYISAAYIIYSTVP